MRGLARCGLLGSDIPFPNAEVLAEQIARHRYSLTPEEAERDRVLGAKTAVAVEKTLMVARPGEKESDTLLSQWR